LRVSWVELLMLPSSSSSFPPFVCVQRTTHT
jgi:hypothetical protein